MDRFKSHATLSLSENWSSRHYGMAKHLLTSRQIHFVFITYSSSSWNWPLSTAAVTGHLCPIIFKWLYFKHLWAKNIFSHSSRVKIICLESFSQMSISIFVLCWTGSNKSTMGFIHKNATILIFLLSKM